MRRVPVLLAMLCIAATFGGCQSMIDDRVDSYLGTLEDRAIRDALSAAESVGAPTELYADLWDKNADPAQRLRLAGRMIAELFINGVPPQGVIHCTIAVAIMLGHQYRGDP